jgi:CBS domain-containing protein
MLRVRDIMTTDVITVSPETTLREAMELFAKRHVSGAPVVAGGAVLGVVSSTDLMMFAAALAGVPTERDAAEDWPEDADLTGSALGEGDGEDDGAPTFFADLWDDAGADVTARMEANASPEWAVLDEHEVSEVMTRAPLTTLPPTAGVEWAADLMRRQRIHRILITEGEALAGIVSALDIVAAVADHRLTARQFVFNDARAFPDG